MRIIIPRVFGDLSPRFRAALVNWLHTWPQLTTTYGQASGSRSLRAASPTLVRAARAAGHGEPARDNRARRGVGMTDVEIRRLHATEGSRVAVGPLSAA